jgi:hypothetical protein
VITLVFVYVGAIDTVVKCCLVSITTYTDVAAEVLIFAALAARFLLD